MVREHRQQKPPQLPAAAARRAEAPCKELASEEASEEAWKRHLGRLGIVKDRHVRIATEGALLGSVPHHGFPEDLAIISDAAGRFNVMLHALCWIHAT